MFRVETPSVVTQGRDSLSNINIPSLVLWFWCCHCGVEDKVLPGRKLVVSVVVLGMRSSLEQSVVTVVLGMRSSLEEKLQW